MEDKRKKRRLKQIIFCEKCGRELPILDEAGTGNAGVSETPKADNAGGPVPP